MTVTLHHGDALDVLRAMPDSSVDAVVTDPPYGLAEHKPGIVLATMLAWCTGDRDHVPDGRGFMGRDWDRFVPPPAIWDECLRVLKPGGHLLCFAGTRTVDLMGISIRLAGFEIRDAITWLYGSGFPKSLDVGKAIDKRPGVVLHREFAAHLTAQRTAAGLSRADVSERVVGTRSGACWNWEHHQFPEAKWWPALRDFLGMDEGKWGPIIAEAERARIGTRTTGIGTGRGSVAIMGDGDNRDITAPATDAARQWQGWGTALKPASEPIIVARKPLQGTVAANVLAHGTGALNVDGCRVETDVPRPARVPSGRTGDVFGAGLEGGTKAPDTTAGRWSANVVLTHAPDCADPCAPGCPVAELDAQSGTSSSTPSKLPPGRRPRGMGEQGERKGDPSPNGPTYADQGGASRFFATFRYQAKAPTKERPKVWVPSPLRLRADLTDDQRAYVLDELKQAGIDVA